MIGNNLTEQTISGLIKGAPLLSADDTVGRAAGLLHALDGSSLLAVNNGQILGMVSEQAIAGFLAGSADPEQALDHPIGPLVEPNTLFVNPSVTLRQAAEVFGSAGVDVLPVIGPLGAYGGVIYRRDVVGALAKTARPPSVAGMATPLGVYLTTGSLHGGVGNLGLFLSGASLTVFIAAASVIVKGFQAAFTAATRIPLDVYLASPPLTTKLNVYDLAYYVSTALTVAIMLLLLRLSPLSGYHAAEHMTVHAIEAGETLTMDNVRRMPRVHPRCGTNLLAAAGVFLILTTKVSNQLSVMFALVVVILGWRAVGGWLQYFVTTKNPSEKQLANGVAAGAELLRRFQERPNHQLHGFDRIWRLGFLQTASGMVFTALVFYMLARYCHMPWLDFQGF